MRMAEMSLWDFAEYIIRLVELQLASKCGVDKCMLAQRASVVVFKCCDDRRMHRKAKLEMLLAETHAGMVHVVFVF